MKLLNIRACISFGIPSQCWVFCSAFIDTWEWLLNWTYWKNFWPRNPSSKNSTRLAVNTLYAFWAPYRTVLVGFLVVNFGQMTSSGQWLVRGSIPSLLGQTIYLLIWDPSEYFLSLPWGPQVRMAMMWTRDPCLSRVREKAWVSNLCVEVTKILSGP